MDEQERQRILGLPFGQFKPARDRLKKEIVEMKKKAKKKQQDAKYFSAFGRNHK